MTLFEQAQAKVRNSAVLANHEEFILADSPEGDEHLTWVVSAHEEEILDWVESSS